MRTDRGSLAEAMQQNNISRSIVEYLRQQQIKNSDFFNLLMNKKMNGRIFYNTCLPGSKEIRYGNEDFLKPNFQAAVDHLLADFKQLSTSEFRTEFMRPSELSIKMNTILTSFLAHLETSSEWQKFWEHEIKLDSNATEKKRLYNLIAGNAAYKAFVSCANNTAMISSPQIKNNIVMLIGICSEKYESTHLTAGDEFQFNNMAESIRDVSVFKTPLHTQQIISDNSALVLK